MKRALAMVIPFAAVAIALAAWWRISIDDDLPRERSASDVLRRAAPSFVLFDQNRQMVKLERYFTRTPVLLVFFSAEQDVRENEWLMTLREKHNEITAAGIVVVGVTTMTPAELHRQTTEQGVEFPFPLTSDIELNNPHPAPAHDLYGLYDADTRTTQPGTFFIHQDGTVASTLLHPVPVENKEEFLASLLAGEA